jgi:tetratricopeptide (TPR) repeat protein
MGCVQSGISVLLFTFVAAAAGEQETAFEWNERGVAAGMRGDFAEAEQDYQKALTLWRALGPAYEGHTATTLYNLGQTFVGEGRWRESIPIFQEALELGRRSFGIRHSRTLATLNTLGRVYMVTGDLDRSAAAFLEALPIEREMFPNGIELAQTLGNLAVLRTRQDWLPEALALADEGLAMAIKALGDDAPDTATMYAIVAAIHQRAGRTERALPLFRKAHAIYDRTIPPQDLRYVSLLSSEALSLMDDHHFSEAENQLRRALELLSPCASRCGLALAIAENNFGLLRMAQKKYAEADAYLRSALAHEEQYSAGPGGDMVQTLKHLAALREKQHRYEESAALKQRIAAVQSSYR